YQAYCQRGGAHYALGNSRQSIVDYSMFLLLAPPDDPRRAAVFRFRAYHYESLKMYAEAVGDLQKLVAEQPESAEDDNHLAWLYATGPLNLRDPAKAVYLMRRAVKLAPKDAKCWNTLG